MNVPLSRLLLLLLVVLLASWLLAAAHYYLATRLIFDPGVPDPWRTPLLALVFGLGATLILQPVGERWLAPPLSRAIGWTASLWMGLAFLLLVQLLATDALFWLAGCVAGAAASGPRGAPGVGLPGRGRGSGGGSAARGHRAGPGFPDRG